MPAMLAPFPERPVLSVAPAAPSPRAQQVPLLSPKQSRVPFTVPSSFLTLADLHACSSLNECSAFNLSCVKLYGTRGFPGGAVVRVQRSHRVGWVRTLLREPTKTKIT